MIPDYCGFAGWPECADLAATGGDGDLMVFLGVLAFVLLAGGVAGMFARRER